MNEEKALPMDVTGAAGCEAPIVKTGCDIVSFEIFCCY